MADDMRWRGGQEATRREFDTGEAQRNPGRDEPRNYSSGRPYGDGDYGWRGGYREYGWRDVPGYERPSAHNPGTSDRDEPFDRDYSGVSWGLSGGHRQDRDVSRTGAGLEAGYANFHRPDAPDRAAGEWRVPGPHAGRGPRGYRRSDQRIADDVNDRLTAHGWIDAADVECKVEEGEVLLTGFVDSRAAKRAAEDVAESVSGVRDVHNHLRVRTNAPDHDGLGRTSVLGLTEHQVQTPAKAPDRGR